MTSKLVSVIIPCFNHGSYLHESVGSVLAQSYKNVEIIVVDDGSRDNTAQIAKQMEGVRYVFQENQGLSAARNTGIGHSKGDYLLFLDADDWLLPNGIATNISYFQNTEDLGFVTGNYISYYADNGQEKKMNRVIKQDPYADLLLYNHIKMHASVLFPRWVLEKYRYDTSLRASEDWDLYLSITRHHSILQHNEPIAVYRRYSTSMSRNNIVMLNTGLQVLAKQKGLIRTRTEKTNLHKGKKRVIEKFTKRLYKEVQSGDKVSLYKLSVLFRYNKSLCLFYLASNLLLALRLRKRKPTVAV